MDPVVEDAAVGVQGPPLTPPVTSPTERPRGGFVPPRTVPTPFSSVEPVGMTRKDVWNLGSRTAKSVTTRPQYWV